MKLGVLALLIITSAGMFRGFARAEEAGSGHYLPGATSSFIDMLPDRGTSTFAYLNAFTYYHGPRVRHATSNWDGRSRPTSKALSTPILLFSFTRLHGPLLGGQYGAALVVPYVWMDVKANLLPTDSCII